MLASGILEPGLDQDIRLENAFDILLASAPAQLFFMSLVKETSINMVLHSSVDVQCGAATHIAGDPATGTIVTYRLYAIARSGVYGSLDYVQRRLQASVSRDPP